LGDLGLGDLTDFGERTGNLVFKVERMRDWQNGRDTDRVTPDKLLEFGKALGQHVNFQRSDSRKTACDGRGFSRLEDPVLSRGSQLGIE